MRILYLTTGYAQGALASLTGHVAHALTRLGQRDGHTVCVADLAQAHSDETTPGVCPATTQPEWIRGVAVTRVPIAPTDSQLTALTTWLAAQAADVVHCVLAQPADLPLAEWPAMGAPMLATLTALPAQDVRLQPQWLSTAKLCVVPNASAQALWAAVYPAKPFKILPHGVDLLALLRQRADHNSNECPHPPTVLIPSDSTGAEEELQVLHSLAHAHRVHLVHSPKPLVSLLAAPTAIDAVFVPYTHQGAFSLVEHECAALGLPCIFLAKPGAGGIGAWIQGLENWLAGFQRSAVLGLETAMPPRIEEEAFYYGSLYRQLA